MSIANPLTALSLSELRQRTSAKWRRYPSDTLPLWVAEMDVALAEPVRETLERVVREGDTGYPGDAPYVESFIDFASPRWNWTELKPTNIAPVADVITGYADSLIAALSQRPGYSPAQPGTVVVTSPVYPPFYSYLRAVGLEVAEARLTPQMRLDLEALDFALSAIDGPRAILLCNPHNPGGTLHTRAELEGLAEVAAKHQATVVSDEIHAPITYSDGEFIPYLTVAGGERGFALHSASKAFNLAAMPAALLVAGADAGEAWKAYRAGTHHGPTHWGMLAQTAAYRDGGPWLAALLEGLDANRKLLRELLANHVPEAVMHPLESTYLAWVDCTALGLGEDPAKEFLDQGRVVFNSGPTFGSGGQGHVRINIATNQQILTEAVERMASVLR